MPIATEDVKEGRSNIMKLRKRILPVLLLLYKTGIFTLTNSMGIRLSMGTAMCPSFTRRTPSHAGGSSHSANYTKKAK